MLVNSIYRFPPQMVFFTTPELLEIGGLPFVSPFDKPTRAEALTHITAGSSTAFDLPIAFEERVLSCGGCATGRAGVRGRDAISDGGMAGPAMRAP